jgi:hypothetical protein
MDSLELGYTSEQKEQINETKTQGKHFEFVFNHQSN